MQPRSRYLLTNTAPSRAGPQPPRRLRNLASPTSNRIPRQLPTPRRRLTVAYRPGPRTTARRRNAPPQRHRPLYRRRHALGQRIRSIREAVPRLPTDHRRAHGHLPLRAPLPGPQEPRGRAEVCRARAPDCARAPGDGVEGAVGEPRHDGSDCWAGSGGE